MAKVKSPLHSVQAAGKADGLIYARNQYGAYTRDYVEPDQPGSPGQLTWQDAMTTVNGWWNNIAIVTPLRLVWWQSFANQYKGKNRFGQPCKWNAKIWFTKHNIWRAATGRSVIPDPPKDPTSIWFPQVDIYWDTDGIFATVFPHPTSTRFVYLRGSGPHNHTRTFPPNTMEFLGEFSSATSNPLKLVDSALIDTDPHNWFIQYRTVDEFGRASPPVYNTVFTYGDPPTAIVAPSFVNRLDEDDPNGVHLSPLLSRYYSNSGSAWRSLFVFNYSAVGYEFTKKSYLYYYPNADSVGTFSLHQWLLSWFPNVVTWNERNTGVAWNEPGGEPGVDFYADPFFTQTAPDIEDVWSRVDITSWVNSMLAAGNTNVSFWVWPKTAGAIGAWDNAVDSSARLPYILNVPLVTP